MVVLDYGLINRARRLITGGNVRRAKQLIFIYEQAVLLHNEGAPKHVVYQEKHENDLRQFTEQEGGRRANLEISRWQDNRWFEEHNQAVIQHAVEAIEKAQRVEKQCQDLEGRVSAALLLRNNTVSPHVARRGKERRNPAKR